MSPGVVTGAERDNSLVTAAANSQGESRKFGIAWSVSALSAHGSKVLAIKAVNCKWFTVSRPRCLLLVLQKYGIHRREGKHRDGECGCREGYKKLLLELLWSMVTKQLRSNVMKL